MKEHRSCQGWARVEGKRRTWEGAGQGSQPTGFMALPPLCDVSTAHLTLHFQVGQQSPPTTDPLVVSLTPPPCESWVMLLVSIMIYFQAAELWKMPTVSFHSPCK